MSFVTVLGHIWGHPLNQKFGRVKGITRFVRWQLAQRLMPVPMALPLVAGSSLVLTKGLSGGTGNWYCGLYEADDMAFTLHVLRPGDLFCDVGANVGTYTVLAAAGVGANVISVEASPTTYERLYRNVRFNDLTDRVDARCIGASDRPGTLRFSKGLDAVDHVLAEGENIPSVDVPVDALDNILADKTPKLLKIDVEGHEKAVLEGAQAVLGNPGLLAVIMETNGLSSRFGIDQEDVFAFMARHGLHPHRYDLTTRTLTPGSTKSNTIFVRDVAVANELCRTAPEFDLINGRI